MWEVPKVLAHYPIDQNFLTVTQRLINPKPNATVAKIPPTKQAKG
jgi:hypothetical protein